MLRRLSSAVRAMAGCSLARLRSSTHHATTSTMIDVYIRDMDIRDTPTGISTVTAQEECFHLRTSLRRPRLACPCGTCGTPPPWLGLAFLGVRLPCRAPRRYALRLKCSARPALRSARGATTELRPTSSPTARALKPLCTVHACVHAFSRTRPRRPFLVTGPSSRQTTGGR